jgi:hypothetical protein
MRARSPFGPRAVALALGAAVALTSGVTALAASGAAPPPTLPLDQWLATGHITTVTATSAVHAGDVLVRAWFFEEVCHAADPCGGRFVRQLSGGGAQAAEIQEIPGAATASFAPTIVPCGSGTASKQGTEHDVYSWRTSPVGGRLRGVQERSTFTGCGSGTGVAGVTWSAVAVPLVRAPAFEPSAAHSANGGAFLRALTRTCTAVNAQLAPLTAQMSRDAATIRAASGKVNAAAATAAASLATLYPRLLPIVIEDYTTAPQPPPEFDGLWVVYGDLQRQELRELPSALAALNEVYSALSAFERTGSTTALQQALAEETLAAADQSSIAAAHRGAIALAKQLRVPGICTAPPALAAVGGYLLP